MRITVLTASFNAANTLGDTISSVHRQKHQDVEHIVIDGGSHDATHAVVGDHRDAIDKFVSEPDQGMYDALNKGLRLASGDIIGTLNADDCYATPDVLDAVAAVFSDPRVEACYGDLVYVAQHDPKRIVRYWRSSPQRPGMIERGWYPAHPTFFVRRHVYEQHGGFDLDFGTAADVELMMRFLGRHRIRAEYIPRVLVRMRMGGVSNRSLRNIVAQNIQLYRAFRKNQLQYSPLFPLYKLPSRLRQFVTKPARSL